MWALARSTGRPRNGTISQRATAASAACARALRHADVARTPLSSAAEPLAPQTADPEPQASPPADQPEKPAQKAKRSKPVVFGYVQAHYRHSRDTSEDGIVDAPNFRVQRVRLGVEGDIFATRTVRVT